MGHHECTITPWVFHECNMCLSFSQEILKAINNWEDSSKPAYSKLAIIPTKANYAIHEFLQGLSGNWAT